LIQEWSNLTVSNIPSFVSHPKQWTRQTNCQSKPSPWGTNANLRSNRNEPKKFLSAHVESSHLPLGFKL
jgi:hypothetical protein